MSDSILLCADSYKGSHFKQYPPGCEHIYSYIESRGGKYDRTLFFGLQMFIMRYLLKPITAQQVDEAETFYKAHGVPFNREGWDHIVKAHDGLLPVLIKAVPEGYVIPTGNVLVTVVNTDPKCFWLTSYLETALLRAVWYPTTVATQSWHIKQTIAASLEKTGDPEGLPFKLHDFGARGVSSSESAAIGGAAHLVNFMGSDTIEGILAANRYYSAGMAGFSIPAAEHSTITSWGRDGEEAAYANMLTQFAKPGAILAVVSDSYNLWTAIDKMWGDSLRQQVIDSGATLVIRPDSGDPHTVPVEAVKALGVKFGTTTNAKGYKVLPPCVRVIQGDGINTDSISRILFGLTFAGYSADNVSFGMGGALLQGVNRDTQKFAMKASAAKVNGVWRDVFKDPVDDQGKRSKRGHLALTREYGSWQTLPWSENAWCDVLRPVFRDGELLRQQTFVDIRENSNREALD